MNPDTRKPVKMNKEVHRLMKTFCARHGILMQHYIESAVIRSLAEDFSADALVIEANHLSLPEQVVRLLDDLRTLDSDHISQMTPKLT